MASPQQPWAAWVCGFSDVPKNLVRLALAAGFLAVSLGALPALSHAQAYHLQMREPLPRGVDPGSPNIDDSSLSIFAPLFADVAADYWARSWIEALYRAGVTGGCGIDPLRYCPDSPVTREQIAVFLLKAKEGPGYTPNNCETAPFTDVPCSSPYARWIAELVRRGITAGCGDGHYCPGTAVTREQMAVFLVRTVESPTYSPPACTSAIFIDVPCSSGFAPWVYQLVARGITAGCATDRYCGQNAVTRAQMAVFMIKTFDLFARVIGLFPSEGTSGSRVTIIGFGFAPTSRVRFGQTEAPAFFISAYRLDVMVPLAADGSPLPPGTLAVVVDDGASSSFTITTLPSNPNPPGQVLQDTLLWLSQSFTTIQPRIDAAIAAVRPATTDPNVAAMLDTYAPIAGTLANFLAALPNELPPAFDPVTLSTVERLLLTLSPASVVQPRIEALVVSAVAGDDFLDTRQTLVETVNVFSGLSTFVSVGCRVPNQICGVATILLSLAQFWAEVVVQIEAGEIVGVDIDAPTVVSRTPDRTQIKVPIQTPPLLTAKIRAQRLYGKINPLQIALTKIQWARKTPGVVTSLPMNIQEALDRLEHLVSYLPSFGLPIGQPRSLDVTFSRLMTKPLRCEKDSVPALSLLESGQVKLTSSGGFPPVPCLLSLKPRYLLVSEYGVYHEVEFVPDKPRLTVEVNGIGRVDSVPGGIQCVGPATCYHDFDAGAIVTLTATPSSSFSGWSGDCTGIGPCNVTMDRAKKVTARFSGVPDIVGSYHLVSYRGVPVGGFCGESLGCGTGFHIAGGAAVFTDGGYLERWHIHISARFPDDPTEHVIFSNGGEVYLDRRISEPLNYPDDPDCTGPPHWVPEIFFCSQLPPGWLHMFNAGGIPMFTPLGVLLDNNRTFVSAFGGQTVWERD